MFYIREFLWGKGSYRALGWRVCTYAKQIFVTMCMYVHLLLEKGH